MTCPLCHGPAWLLGQLSRLLHFRCRDCGAQFHHDFHHDDDCASFDCPYDPRPCDCGAQFHHDDDCASFDCPYDPRCGAVEEEE